jgi:hypothetical protein
MFADIARHASRRKGGGLMSITPDYNKRAQKASRERKKALGYKWVTFLTTPAIVAKLRAAYQRYKKQEGLTP